MSGDVSLLFVMIEETSGIWGDRRRRQAVSNVTRNVSGSRESEIWENSRRNRHRIDIISRAGQEKREGGGNGCVGGRGKGKLLVR